MPTLGFSRDRHPGRKPALTDVELLCLLVAQHLLGTASDRKWIRYAHKHLTGMFPNLPQQSGWGKRVRQATGLISAVITELARDTPTWGEVTSLIDSRPLPGGKSRETVKRSDLASHAGYGYCTFQFRLYLICTPEGMPSSGGWRTRRSASEKPQKRFSATTGISSSPGVYSRVAARLLALAAGIWHNWLIGVPGKRSLIAYDH